MNPQLPRQIEPRLLSDRTALSALPLLYFLINCGVAADTLQPRRLTHDADFKQHLQWSPDGQKFLFTRIHEGKMGLWTMNADGSDIKRLLNHDEAPDFDGVPADLLAPAMHATSRPGSSCAVDPGADAPIAFGEIDPGGG